MGFFESLDRTQARPTQTNWENRLQTLVDEYEQHGSIAHGVQKDALQNGWDARLDKKGADGWRFEFQLHEEPSHVFLTLTDSGTIGLTGRVLGPEELTADLPAQERWGRFENLAFTKDPAEEALGARGQGKFIFVAASKTRRILYDTLRADGVYRLGARVIENACTNVCWSWEGREAKDMLEQFCPLLKPLTAIGTRVIIDDPIDELLAELRSGSFLDMIGETWWEILQKFDADISLRVNGRVKRATVPGVFDLAEADSQTGKVWVKEKGTVIAEGESYRIKRLHLEYVKGRCLPEEFQGVAVQRGGMRICLLPFRYVGKDIAKAVTGYVQFDRHLDGEMKLYEDPTHYSFSWRKGVARQVRQWVEDQLEEFGKAKLGLGVSADEKRHRHQSEAEKLALRYVNMVAKELGVSGTGVGGKGTRTQTDGGTPVDAKPIRLQVPPFDFPTQSLRVDPGQAIKNITCQAINDSASGIDALVKSYVLYGDDIIANLLSDSVVVPARAKSKYFGPLELTVADERFSRPGRYAVRFRLIAQSCPGYPKGFVLDEVTRTFYVLEDPPQGGLFEKCMPMDFPKECEAWRGDIKHGEGGGWIYRYNLCHHEKVAVGDEVEDLTEYLFRLLVEALFEIDLRQEKPKLFTSEDLESHVRIAQVIGKKTGEIMHGYFGRS